MEHRVKLAHDYVARGTKGYVRYVSEAENQIAISTNRGWIIKSHLKDILDSINRAYDATRELQDAKWLEIYQDESLYEIYRKHSDVIPYGLHQVRETKHKEALEYMNTWDKVQYLLKLREETKEIEIIARPKKEKTEEELIKEAVLARFASEAHKEKFDWATEMMVELRKRYDNVDGISNTTVYCSNEFNTEWLRTDWYFKGTRTAFQIILAAVIKSQRIVEGKE